MPRGRRRAAPAVTDLENELEGLKRRQAELRAQIRAMRGNSGSIRKLEEKLAKQLAGAKWLAQQIQELQPGWDEVGFYQGVQAKQPTPRGRRPRAAAEAS